MRQADLVINHGFPVQPGGWIQETASDWSNICKPGEPPVHPTGNVTTSNADFVVGTFAGPIIKTVSAFVTALVERLVPSIGIRTVASESLAAAAGQGPDVAGAAVRFGPVNPGPLPDVVANTFRSGSYTQSTLSEATTFYRAYGGTAPKVGSFWTRTEPSGPLQATIDLALNPAWGNTATEVAAIQVPTGTTIFEGAAAAQGGLVGGGSQIYLQTVPASWVIW